VGLACLSNRGLATARLSLWGPTVVKNGFCTGEGIDEIDPRQSAGAVAMPHAVPLLMLPVRLGPLGRDLHADVWTHVRETWRRDIVVRIIKQRESKVSVVPFSTRRWEVWMRSAARNPFLASLSFFVRVQRLVDSQLCIGKCARTRTEFGPHFKSTVHIMYKCRLVNACIVIASLRVLNHAAHTDLHHPFRRQ
jgi:hypothetical protein